MIMTNGLLPDACRTHWIREFTALELHWIRGFVAFQLVRHGRIVMLMVTACPESGFR